MVVVRPDGLLVIDVEIEFNFLNYSKLEIDLHNINRGKKLTRYSNFSLEEVLIIVKTFFDGEVVELDIQKHYGDESCNYFSMIKKHQGNNYKLVLCICSDRVDALGIMTLYRLRS